MRCPYCGNENPDDHRFCGMCGRAIPAPAAEPIEPARHRDSESSSAPAPAYTGGIFNLGAPADSAHRDLNYLLDDEEPKSHTGLIGFFLIALALAGGLGYLRWRNGSLPSLRSLMASSKPAPAAAPDAAANSPAPDTSTAPTPAAQPPAEPPSSTPANPAATTAPAATPPSPAPSTPVAPESSPATSAANSPTPAAADAGTPGTTGSTPPGAVAKPPAETTEKPAEAPVPSTPPAHVPPKPVAEPKPAAKPAPKPAAKAPDQVALGEQYLYGRGVPQNCERGLRYVKPAADQANTKAMITMGALYATGHCISRDLPTAYRFFALALRSDPENGPLRQNAEMVWKQMTSEERKQAIRLTQ